MLDVLTPLSDCREESVEKMERRVSGVSYMCWMNFHNGTLCCGFSRARLISVCLFSGYHAEGYHAPPVCLFSGYRAEGYHAPPIPSGYHAEGYHARTDTFKLTGYHVCRVTTPELPRSKQTSGCRRVITPAGSFLLFFLSSVNTSVSPSTATTFPPSLAHTARTRSTR